MYVSVTGVIVYLMLYQMYTPIYPLPATAIAQVGLALKNAARKPASKIAKIRFPFPLWEGVRG